MRGKLLVDKSVRGHEGRLSVSLVRLAFNQESFETCQVDSHFGRSQMPACMGSYSLTTSTHLQANEKNGTYCS